LNEDADGRNVRLGVDWEIVAEPVFEPHACFTSNLNGPKLVGERTESRPVPYIRYAALGGEIIARLSVAGSFPPAQLSARLFKHNSFTSKWHSHSQKSELVADEQTGLRTDRRR